jgi:predicted TIM-barrel fold metal-dependent hydrolase
MKRSTGNAGRQAEPRRRFMAGMAALGASVFIPGCATEPQRPAVAGRPHRIDVHHHFHPPSYMVEVAKLAPRETTQANWTVARSLADMDKSGIATAVLSLTQPQVWFGDVAIGRRLTQECNDYGAKLVQDHAGRFGLFATLPLPDAEGSLRAVEYAFDTLNADGIGIMTSYGKQYLGDRAFWPVYEELNRRKAVVYTHPLSPACCVNPLPQVLRDSSVELGTDTTRTIASVLFSGTAARFPDIRWIFSHAGGTMPYLYQRFLREEAALKNAKQVLPNGLLHEVKKFHYDAAQSAQRSTLSAFLTLVPASQLMVGSDFPARPGSEVVAGLMAYGFSTADMEAIDRGNALKLLPRLKG